MRHLITCAGKLALSQHAVEQLFVRWHLLFGTAPLDVVSLLQRVVNQAKPDVRQDGSTHYTAGYITLVVRNETIVTVLINGYTEKQRSRGKPRLTRLCA